MDFLARLSRSVVFSAGSLGTSVLAQRPSLRGGCIESLVLTEPPLVQRIQHAFYAAGCDAVDSLTFGANALALGGHGLEQRSREINRQAAVQLNAVRDHYSTADWPRYSTGSMGPGILLPSRGEVTIRELREVYGEQARGLLEGGIDVLKVETCRDLGQATAALDAIAEVFRETDAPVPVIASVTLQPDGTLLTGPPAPAALAELEGHPVVDIVGINCCAGPDDVVAVLEHVAGSLRKPLFAAPNAGLPTLDGDRAEYPVSPDAFAKYQRTFVEEYGVRVAGGCCGTTPAHAAAAIAAIRGKEAQPGAGYEA